MKSKIFILISCLAMFFSIAFADDYKRRFDNLFTEGDSSGQKKLLDKWEKSGGDSPEFYVSYFNYCVKNSMKETVWTSAAPAGAGSLKIIGKDETGEDVVTYMNFETIYDKELLKQGFEMIEKGIKKYPKRLDMRFGEIYMYGEIGDYDKFASKIIDTVEYSYAIKNEWLWKDGNPVENPENIMLGAIQDYQVKLYNTGDDSLLDDMESIAEAVLKYYPDHVESLSNLSLVYSIRKQYGKALEVLSKAEKITPRDCIVLNNMAHVYWMSGNVKQSVKYYKLITKYGDQKQKAFALERIEELSKK